MLFKTPIFELLLNAIKTRDKDEVQVIIEEAIAKKIDLSKHTREHVTLLHWAILQTNVRTQDDMLEIIKLLYDAGINVNQCSNDSLQFCPLHTASRRALPKIVQWLVDNGADPLIQDSTDRTPLAYVTQTIKNVRLGKNPHFPEGMEERFIEVENILLHSQYASLNYYCTIL